MNRRHIVTAMVVSLVSFATGCSDVTSPTAAAGKVSLPRGPSLIGSFTSGGDITYDISGGTLRIWDTEITAPSGRVSGDSAWANPSAAMTFTGKWQIVTSGCAGCYAHLFLTWSRGGAGFTPLGGDSVEVIAGTQGTFAWTTAAPSDLGQSAVVFWVGDPSSGGGFGPAGRLTGTALTRFDPFLVFVTNDDLTGPSISPELTGTLGDAGWYTSDVGVNWIMTDDKSEITGNAGCGSATITTDGPTTRTCSATSAGGNTSKDVTIKRDATKPTIVLSASPAANGAGWNKADVTVSWTCTDATSGVVAAGASKTLSVEGANQSATGDCADKAGNTSSDTKTGINIDKTAPTLTPTTSPAEILLNAVATASPNASDALSGIGSQSCDPMITSVAGQFSVNCTATDKAGNIVTKSVAYVVKSPYTFSGFLAPIAGGSTLNAVTAGSGVPIKFRVGGNKGLSILAGGSPTSKPYACSASSSVVTIATSTASNGGGLSYDAKTDTYTYLWKTEKSWGGTCRTLILKLTDGIEHTANFSFKK